MTGVVVNVIIIILWIKSASRNAAFTRATHKDAYATTESSRHRRDAKEKNFIHSFLQSFVRDAIRRGSETVVRVVAAAGE